MTNYKPGAWLLVAAASVVLTGCALERTADREAARQQTANASPAPTPAATATPVTSGTDIEKLRRDRVQDAQVIQDAQRAVGASHP
jgi:hypothetical protein